jgi:hypothetical protein
MKTSLLEGKQIVMFPSLFTLVCKETVKLGSWKFNQVYQYDSGCKS